MRHVLRGIIVAVVVLGMAGTAMAGRELAAQKLATVEATPIFVGPSGGVTTCQLGNLNAAAWGISGMVPPDELKLAFDPMSTCSVCPVGFKVNKVHAYVQVAGACQIVMGVDIEEAVYPSAGCTAPGPVVCASDFYQVNLPGAGMYNIGIPITCDCLTMGRSYLMSVHFEDATCDVGLITDDGPAGLCLNWDNYGQGWYDLLAAYDWWPGQLKFFADAECCTPSVPVDGRTWGSIKGMYNE